jgi:hypothetical protein
MQIALLADGASGERRVAKISQVASLATATRSGPVGLAKLRWNRHHAADD